MMARSRPMMSYEVIALPLATARVCDATKAPVRYMLRPISALAEQDEHHDDLCSLELCASFEDSSRARSTMPWSSIASAEGLMALLGIQQRFDALSVILYYTRCPASSTGTDSVPCSMLL